MIIEKNAKVRINYTLTNDDGELLDSSNDREAFSFLQGAGEIIPGLERALEGRTEGESFEVSIGPEEGYGEYDPELVFEVPSERFQESTGLEAGVQVQAQMQDGSTRVLTVREVGDDHVTLDANHPLAGETLHFSVEVAEVSEATAEEIDHGHAHGHGHNHGHTH